MQRVYGSQNSQGFKESRGKEAFTSRANERPFDLSHSQLSEVCTMGMRY